MKRNSPKNFSQFPGAAVIIRPPENQTVLENAEVRIPCEGQAEPANLTVKWYKDGIPVHKMGTLGYHLCNISLLSLLAQLDLHREYELLHFPVQFDFQVDA